MSPHAKKPVKLFRRDPPREFVETILQRLGFQGFNDLRWFRRDDLRQERLEELLPELEAYYLPCKAVRFLHTWSDHTLLTILRHILRVYEYTLYAEERVSGGEKQTVYQIQPVRPYRDLSGVSLEVRFE
jgi:hypothetical protein